MEVWAFETDQKTLSVFNQRNRTHLTVCGRYREWLDMAETLVKHVIGKNEWNSYVEPFRKSNASPRRDRLFSLEYRLSHPSFPLDQRLVYPPMCKPKFYGFRFRRACSNFLFTNDMRQFLCESFLSFEDRQSVYLDIFALDVFFERYMRDMVYYRKAYHECQSEQKASLVKVEWVKAAAKKWVKQIDITAIEPSMFTSIAQDLERTIPDSKKISSEKGKQSLRHVLSVIALLFPQVGYCQSMNYIAAFMLTLFDHDIGVAAASMAQLLRASDGDCIIAGHLLFPTKIDPKCSPTITPLKVCMMETIGLRNLDYYGANMEGIKRDMKVFHLLLFRVYPKLLPHLQSNDVANLDVWLMKSFLTVFVHSYFAPISVVHLWDAIFIGGAAVEGGSMTLLFTLHLTFVGLLVSELLKARSIEQIDQVFKKNIFYDNCCRVIYETFTKPHVTGDEIHKMRIKEAKIENYSCKGKEKKGLYYDTAGIGSDLSHFALFSAPAPMPLIKYPK